MRYIFYTFLFFLPLISNAQYFHEIPVCFEEIETQVYRFDRDPQLVYDISVTNGEIITQSNNSISIKWNYEFIGQLNISVTNDIGCTNESTLTMTPIECDRTRIYVPNTFTPNSDDRNDTFRPIGENITNDKYEFSIYNRWGEEIFFTGNFEVGWDGRYKGKICQRGVYVYKITYLDESNNLKIIRGHVTLLK